MWLCYDHNFIKQSILERDKLLLLVKSEEAPYKEKALILKCPGFQQVGMHHYRVPFFST